MFAGHGEYSLHLKGNILVSHAYGAWNKETALAYVKDAEKIIAPVVHKKWAVLTHISEWELNTPDVDIIHIKIIESCIDLGLRREAVINDSGLIKMEQFKKSDSSKGGFQRKFFELQSDGLAWLNSEGFHF